MSWKYKVITKMKPNNPKKATEIAAAAAENRGFRKKRTSSSGFWRRDSQKMNVASSTITPAKARTVMTSVQPRAGASITAHTRKQVEATDSRAPRSEEHTS